MNQEVRDSNVSPFQIASRAWVAWLAAYLIAQAVALACTAGPEAVSVFWPPAGVMLAALVRTDRRQWPALASAFFVTALIVNAALGRGVALGVALAANDVAVGVVGAWAFLRLSPGDPAVQSVRSAAALVAVAAGSALVSATLGAAAMDMAQGTPFFAVWRVWAPAMAIGIGLTAPPFLAPIEIASGPGAKAGRIEAFAAAGLMVAVPTLANLFYDPSSILAVFASRSTVLFVIWTAVRHGVWVATAPLLVVSTVVTMMTLQGVGAAVSAAQLGPIAVIVQQVFLAVNMLTALFIAGALAERRRAEAEAAGRTALMTSIVDTAPDALVLIDEHGRVESFSRAAERLFGYRADEVIGRNVKMLMPQHFRDRHDEYLGRYRATGERRIIGIGRVVAGERKDGSTFPIELSVGEANIAGRRVFTGFVRDLSEAQRAQRRIQEIQAELFHVSRLGEMGQFASGLAHEINQPLAAIMNYAEAAREVAKAHDAEAAKAVGVLLDKIEGQAERAAQIVRRLRRFVEKHETELRPEQLNPMIEEALGLAMIGATARGVRVRFDLAPDLPEVLVDRVQIQQVLVNLVRNALDAMENVPVRELTISSDVDGDGAVKVCVVDSGHGLAPEIARSAFNSFVTTKPDGMGVGLSICRSIVEAHRGRIWHEPNPNGGTAFHFTLPAARAAGDGAGLARHG